MIFLFTIPAWIMFIAFLLAGGMAGVLGNAASWLVANMVPATVVVWTVVVLITLVMNPRGQRLWALSVMVMFIPTYMMVCNGISASRYLAVNGMSLGAVVEILGIPLTALVPFIAGRFLVDHQMEEKQEEWRARRIVINFLCAALLCIATYLVIRD